jgi:HAD superfamily hydrolase (TIGR01509 family)
VSRTVAEPRVPLSSAGLPPAVVFDCDGTLADTESLSDQAWRESLAAHGYEATEADFRAVIGHPFPQNWAYFAAKVDLGDQATFRRRLRGRFLELFDRDLELHDDAVDTLRQLAEAGVPIAVASSSSHEHVLRVLDRGGLTDLVAAVVGADDVPRHKPDPTPYVVAARHLGVEAARCTAVEDTVVGVASAVAAGMFTIAVVRAHGDAEALADADRVVDRVTLEALVRPDEAIVPTEQESSP